MTADERAERLLGQLQQWAIELMQTPREAREALIVEIAARYHEDALEKGLSASQAEDWRSSVQAWLKALVNVIETSGGANGGHA